MSEQRAVSLQKSLVGACAFVAVVLLASFYMVVSGAVQRGQQRMSSVAAAAQTAAQTAVPTVQRAAVRGTPLFARVGH